jgi:hypothetical protein
MPALSGQHAALERTLTAGFVLLRLLTPQGLSHADAVRRYAPYDRLIQPIPRMRTDTLALVEQAVAEGRTAYVLVNNRAEGNAPMTIQALADQIDTLPTPQLP